jgi:glycerol-3-phosphate dehydrogenase
MGRCNGGYCFTRIVDMLNKEYSVAYEDICLKHANDHPFTGVVK